MYSRKFHGCLKSVLKKILKNSILNTDLNSIDFGTKFPYFCKISNFEITEIILRSCEAAKSIAKGKAL